MRVVTLYTLLVLLVVGCSEDESFEERRFQEPSPEVEGQVVVIDPRPEGSVPCASCHTLHNQAPFVERSEQLTHFHTTVEVTHGELACYSCHTPQDPGNLHLASGKPLAFSSAMELCAQCHGPQTRDYQKGSHGGMTGHWDLASGDRQRNACTTCHNPHTPAFPRVFPVFAPKDRFLTPRESHHE